MTAAELPLQTGTQVLGLLRVTLDSARVFRAEELRLLTAVAEMTSGALQRAQVLATLEQRVADRTQALAEANDQLKELDRLKSKFVSDVSHELRTPITSLGLYLDLLNSGKPEKRERYLQVLKNETRRLGQLVEDILSLSRLDLGRVPKAAFKPLDLNPMAHEVVELHRPRAEDRELDLSFSAGARLPSVLGEPNQLNQVMTNLVANAIKYVSGGRIDVSTTWDETREMACFAVTDSGPGIQENDLSHLFERFYRGHAAAQGNIPGNGLGLAIVDEIVRLHGGTLEVFNNEMGGATFRIWLPPAPATTVDSTGNRRDATLAASTGD